MTGDSVGWMESDVFNPAAVVKGDSIVVLFRAEDNSATGIGKRTSRIGYAPSADGVNSHMRSRQYSIRLTTGRGLTRFPEAAKIRAWQ